MKTAAIFAALVMLASSENISRADDYCLAISILVTSIPKSQVKISREIFPIV
jgi:hypothetical protein